MPTTAKWRERPFDESCKSAVARDRETIDAVRKGIADWDGWNWSAVQQYLRASGRLPDELQKMNVHDVRMAFATGQAVLVGIVGVAHTATNTVQRIASTGLSVPLMKKEIARRFGTSPATLEKWIKDGVITVVPVSREYFRVELNDGNRGFLDGPEK